MNKLRDKLAGYIEIVGVQNLLDNNSKSQTKLYNFVKYTLNYICFKYFINEYDKEDIINNTMLTFFQQIESKKPESSEKMSTILLTIHYHNCYDYIKLVKTKSKKKIYSIDYIVDEEVYTEIGINITNSLSVFIESKETNIIDYTILYFSLHVLTKRQLSIIQDYYLKNSCEESLKEIANRLGITYAIAKRDLYRGIAKLKKELNKQGINNLNNFFERQ